MTMFNTKLEVDKHVERCLKRINNDRERNLRGLSFAKLYYNVGEFGIACRYLSAYLSVNPFSAEAYALQGRCLEKQGKKEAAIDAYRSSLHIEPKQNNIILRVCELLASDDVTLDKSCAQHYCEKAQSFDPHNPAVIVLKERLIASDGGNFEDITKLLLNELNSRPTDVQLRVRLLQHLLDHNDISQAYKHIAEIELKNLSIFANSYQWYDVVIEVLTRYQRDASVAKNLSWEFYMLMVSALDSLATLSLDEHCNARSSLQSDQTIFTLDQTLNVAAQKVDACPYRPLADEFLQHYRAQLCFHLMTLLFKQAKRSLIKYKEAVNVTLPLLFVAYHTRPADVDATWLTQASENERNQIKRWRVTAAFRCSQAGHMLLSLAKERMHDVCEKATNHSSGLWREQLFKRAFVARDQQTKITTSYFVTCAQLISEITLRMPDSHTLAKHDDEAQHLYANQLHNYVWICANGKLSQFRCTTFHGLKYSVRNLANAAADSLNLLDVDAFIYCATMCAQARAKTNKQQIQYTQGRPTTLPAALTDPLCTADQISWFTAAYKWYRNDLGATYNEVRVTLSRGIEVVRCIGNHGLHVEILVQLATIFEERSKNCAKQSEIEFSEARAELYWRVALPLLEKRKNHQLIAPSTNRLFEYKAREMSDDEILTHIESAKLFAGVQLMRKKEYEKALRYLEDLHSPYASYHQAHIYKQSADEQLAANTENVTAEMRSQHVILLARARDCLYLTLDRLRKPGTDRKHPLNTQLADEIEQIEKLLNRADPSLPDRNECDGTSDENGSLPDSADDGAAHGLYPNLSKLATPTSFSYTPTRHEQSLYLTPQHSHPLPRSLRKEARPSPERLDAQIRQLQASKDATISHVLEQNRAIVDAQKTLVQELVASLSSMFEEVRAIKENVEGLAHVKTTVAELKVAVEDMQGLRDVVHLVNDMKRDIADLRRDTNRIKSNQLSDEDLYVLDEEYGGEYNVNASNAAAYNTAYYQNQNKMLAANTAHLGGANAAAVAAALYPGMYPMYYPGLNLQPAGTPSYSADTHLQDYKNALTQSNFGQVPLAPLPLNPALAAPTVVQPAPLTNTPVPSHLAHLLSQGPAPVQAPSKTPSIPFTPTSIYESSTNTPTAVTPTVTPRTLSATPSLTNNAAPVNVVITASDPLPTTTNTTATPQILSVTIPPQHLKANVASSKAQPHNYQIPLPASSTLAVTPSIINQPPPTVATENILSHVAPPLYSAIDKSPKSTGLGLKIEKSLSQSLNTSTKSGGSLNASVDEHDPRPDFKPIVPLPDEVPVTTGEENETVLFSERAKLYRYVDKEWRERGVGNLKILRNNETGKVRILMRRDQIHKICANHFITDDVKLIAMPNNERSYAWAVNDYSDQEMRLEKLCVRFKTVEEAQKFAATFEECKKDVQPQKEEVKASVATATTSYGGFIFTSTPTFKPKEAESTPKLTPVPDATTKSSPFASFTFGAKTPSVTSTTNLVSSPIATPTDLTVDQGSSSEQHHEDFVPTAEFKPVVPLPELVDVKTGEENAEILFECRAKLLRFDPAAKEWKERGLGIMKLLKEHVIRLVMRREQIHKVCCNHQLLKEMVFTKVPNNSRVVMWIAKDFSDGALKAETFGIRFKTDEQTSAFLRAIENGQRMLDERSAVVASAKDVIPEIGDATTPMHTTHKEDKKVKASPAEVTAKATGWGDKFKPKSGSWECKTCYITNDAKQHSCIACGTSKNSTTPNKQSDTSMSGPQFSFGVATVTTPSGGFFFGHKPEAADTGVGGASLATPTKPVTQLFKSEADKSLSSDTSTSDLSSDRDDSVTVVVSTASATSVSTTPSAGWGEAFRPKAGSWECGACLVRNNDPDNVYCISCEAPKDDSVPKKEVVSKGINLETGFKFTFGIPPTTATPAAVATPFVSVKSDSAVNTTSTTTASKFSFGPPSTGFSFTTAEGETSRSEGAAVKSFSFGAVTAPTSTTPDANGKTGGEEADKFVFGSPQKHAFEFTPRSPRRVSGGHGDGDESEDSHVEDEGDHIYFKPVVPLPDKIEVRTGEEDETVLYCHRAKLFRFVEGEWKERGLGDVKILRTATTGRVRVVMRREQVLKICLNHLLTNDIEYIRKDEKTWLFTAPDYSEGTINRWQFCIRFKNADVAQQFKNAIDAALSVESAKTESVSDSSDVELISETKVTPEEEAEAIALQLPPKFMAYRQLPDCTCATCKNEDQVLSSLYNKPIKTTPPKSDTLRSLLVKPSVLNVETPKSEKDPTSAFKNFSFSMKEETPTKVSTPTNTFSSTASSTNIFGNVSSNGSIFGSKTPTFSGAPLFGNTTNAEKTTATTASDSSKSLSGNSTSTTPVFGTVTATVNPSFSIFGNTAAKQGTTDSTSGNIFGNAVAKQGTTDNSSSKPAFGAFSFGGVVQADQDKCQVGSTAPLFGSVSFGALGAKSEPSKETTPKEVVLKYDPDLSFANLADKPSFAVPTADPTKAFNFLGKGAPVFASLKSDKENNQSEAKESAEHDEDYDPHYEPIVPLPDAIVVSTGEEEETEIFNSRAKLFLFYAETKEWKERGVGQMKILHHAVNNTYRFLLRREQVHKVVLNMLLTTDVVVQPMTTSEKAYMIGGYNYIEGEMCLEKLSVLFKNVELAREFYAAVQKCLDAIREQEANVLPTSVENYGNETATSGEIQEQSVSRSYEDDEDDDEDDEHDDEDDEDDRSVMFMRPCVLSEQIDDQWKQVAEGDLQIYYDPEIYGSRISFNDQQGQILSNTIIGINAQMAVNGPACTWKAVEWATEKPNWRTLQATFENAEISEEFQCSFLESVQYAHGSDIVDDIPDEHVGTEE